MVHLAGPVFVHKYSKICHGTCEVALAIERRTLYKIVPINVINCRRNFSSFFTNFSHQQNLFQFVAVDISTVLDERLHLYENFAFYFLQHRQTHYDVMENCKLYACVVWKLCHIEIIIC